MYCLSYTGGGVAVTLLLYTYTYTCQLEMSIYINVDISSDDKNYEVSCKTEQYLSHSVGIYAYNCSI